MGEGAPADELDIPQDTLDCGFRPHSVSFVSRAVGSIFASHHAARS